MKKDKVKKIDLQKLFIRFVALIIIAATIMPLVFSLYLKFQKIEKVDENNSVFCATESAEKDGYYIGREYNCEFDSNLKILNLSKSATDSIGEYEEVRGSEIIATKEVSDKKSYSNIVICADGIFNPDGIYITLYDKNAKSLGCKRFSDVVGSDNKLMPFSFDGFTGFVINQVSSSFSAGEIYGARISASIDSCILIKSIYLSNMQVKDKALEYPRFEKEKLKVLTKESFTINANSCAALSNESYLENYEFIVFKIKNSENFSVSNFAVCANEIKSSSSKTKYSNELYCASGISLQDIILSDYPYKSINEDVFLIIDFKESGLSDNFNTLKLYNLGKEKMTVLGVFLANKSELSSSAKDSSEIDYKLIDAHKNTFERFLKLKLKADSVFNSSLKEDDFIDANNNPSKNVNDLEMKFLICDNNILVESRKFALNEFIGDDASFLDASKVLRGEEVIIDLRASQIPPHSAVEFFINGEKVDVNSFENICYIDKSPSYAKSMLSFEKTLDNIPPSLSINLQRNSLSGAVEIMASANDDYSLSEDISIKYSVEVGGVSSDLLDNKFDASNEGAYTVTVQAFDENGNVSLVSETIEITKTDSIARVGSSHITILEILITTAISCFCIVSLLMLYNRKNKTIKN